MKLPSINPSNYEVLGEVEVSTEDEIKAAVASARKAQPEWQEIGMDGRIKHLQTLRQIFHDNQAGYARLISQEMGMPISQSRLDLEEGLRYMDWYLQNVTKALQPEVVFEDENSIHSVYREPIGVAAVIVPWNYPFSTVIWQLIPNLLVGNTVVFKASEEIPLCSQKIEEYIKASTLPQGVFNQVFGDGSVGDVLVHQDIDLISFTGSTKTGQHLYKVAADKLIKVVLEMGGSAPGIVFPDASLDKVAQTVDYNRYGNCGQICDGLKRLIVHEDVFEKVVEKLKDMLKAKNIGLANDEKTDIGPLAAKRQVELLEEQVEDAIKNGAEVVIGGKRPQNLNGAFYEPTILTNINLKMRVWTEEVFGPVLPIVTFKTEQEAIKLANDTQYGLGGYVFTEDNNLALRVAQHLKTGMISTNDISYLQPQDPFGGYKKSGLGREHGHFGFEDLTQIKLIALPK